MIQSMTGYGSARHVVDGYMMQIDIKSVNHRYQEIIVRIPKEWIRFEETIKKAVQGKVQRGRIEIVVTIDKDSSAAKNVQIDWGIIEGYQHAAEQLKARYGLSTSLDLFELLTLPEAVYVAESDVADEERLAENLYATASEAVAELVVMREQEGEFLANDLQERLTHIETLHHHMMALCPEAMTAYRLKLRERILELIEDPHVFDEHKYEMEVAIMADRLSIDEELIRLASHYDQLRAQFQAPHAVGRKMDFIIQEMNREVNTIASKVNAVSLATLVIEMKAELEKIREQVQNIQ